MWTQYPWAAPAEPGSMKRACTTRIRDAVEAVEAVEVKGDARMKRFAKPVRTPLTHEKTRPPLNIYRVSLLQEESNK